MAYGTLQPVFASVGGRHYQVFLGADRQYYLHDPAHLLPFEHTALPSEEPIVGTGVHGLGTSAAQYGAVAATALSFVPMVGPILGPIAGVVSSLFGGGDPTNYLDLCAAVIQYRDALAKLKNQLAGQVVDTFVIPAGLNPHSDGPNGGNTGNVLASKIAAEVLGLGSSDIHKVKRQNMYDAIAALKSAVQDVQAQLQAQQQQTQTQAAIQQAVQQAVTSVAPQPSVVQQVPPTAAPQVLYPYYQQPVQPQVIYQQPTQASVLSSASGISSYLPYIAIGAAVLLAMKD